MTQYTLDTALLELDMQERDYQRMLFCVREQQNGWSPLGVQEMGIEEAAKLAAGE